jgi:lipoprotein NlpD
VTPPAAETVKAMPGAENAGKPGFYSVQRGDTLTRIGLNNGQSWRDLARWNNLTNPDAIEEGQVLRVAPPNATVEASGLMLSSEVGCPPSMSGTTWSAVSAPSRPQIQQTVDCDSSCARALR